MGLGGGGGHSDEACAVIFYSFVIAVIETSLTSLAMSRSLVFMSSIVNTWCA